MIFYINRRLEPEVKWQSQRGRWNKWRQEHYQQMVNKFTDYYQHHEVIPSLLPMGILWASNFLFAGDHKPYLIDPDALFGVVNLILAMTTVFERFR